jgi:hypothetical protein
MNKTEDDYTKGYGDGLKDAYDYWKRNGKLPEPASNTAPMDNNFNVVVHSIDEPELTHFCQVCGVQGTEMIRGAQCFNPKYPWHIVSRLYKNNSNSNEDNSAKVKEQSTQQSKPTSRII